MESGNPIKEKESSLETMNEKANKPSGCDHKIANEVDFERHRQLFDAVRQGNWQESKTYLDQNPDAVRSRIDFSNKTPLHVAVSAGHLHIVEELVQLMTEEDMLMERKDGLTVLAAAIGIGNISIAKCLIRKNKILVSVARENWVLPVIDAVCYDYHEMARYLYTETPEEDLTLRDNGKIGSSLVTNCINQNQFDIPIHLLGRRQGLTTTADPYDRYPVRSLASSITKPVFACRSQLGFWKRWVYDRIHIASRAANQIYIDVQNREDSQIDENDLTPIRSGN
ncbi:uncharacterized protein LOC21395444 [Morus notabilis]|uniref:uncharacterized protein LOC21395444 n=1 Tax=Morus notabilis TaxID=981085 RepID=UPI000CED66D3|nr:uncharacterized protein LOC21395444 [Morus notabilis]